jgi:hypothetical protein
MSRPTKTDPEAARKSLAEWERLMARYPLASRWGLALQITTTLSANGMVAWLIVTRRMTPFELVLLVAIELLLLIAISLLQQRLVPKEAREPSPMRLRERLGMLVFALVWLGGVYAVALLALVPSWDEIRAAAQDPLAFLARSQIKWPLLITLAGAAVDAMQDHAHFRRAGGKFLSTPAMHGGARMLTLVLGGIPFFVPVVAVAVAIKTAFERGAAWLRRRGMQPHSDREALLAVILIPALALPFFGTMGWLLSAGIAGWAVG